MWIYYYIVLLFLPEVERKNQKKPIDRGKKIMNMKKIIESTISYLRMND